MKCRLFQRKVVDRSTAEALAEVPSRQVIFKRDHDLSHDARLSRPSARFQPPVVEVQDPLPFPEVLLEFDAVGGRYFLLHVRPLV